MANYWDDIKTWYKYKNGVQSGKKIHRLWEHYQQIKKLQPDIMPLSGKYQYFFKSKKGVISMINLPNYLGEGTSYWEIYCMKGKLFEDTERFTSKSAANRRIKKLLGMEKC